MQAIHRGDLYMDVVTNVVQMPDGDLVWLTPTEAVIFAVSTPDNGLTAGQMANKASGIRFELGEMKWTKGVSVDTIYNVRSNIHEKLPGWEG